MRINGKWLTCDDGALRPIVQGLVCLVDGQWLEVPFLLDCGSDRTVFSPDLFDLLWPLQTTEAETTQLTGVGGRANAITIETAIGFYRDTGRPISVQGTFRVFTESESADISVLGRDVTNNFSVIYDYSDQIVALLAKPHYYEIKLYS